jgi:hypothetical protein
MVKDVAYGFGGYDGIGRRIAVAASFLVGSFYSRHGSESYLLLGLAVGDGVAAGGSPKLL